MILIPRIHALLVCLLMYIASSAFAQFKLGTVNLQKVFDGYWRTQQASAQLKDRVAEFDKQIKEILDAYQQVNEQYKKLLDSANDQALTTAERELRKKSAEAKLKEAQQLETQYRQIQNVARDSLEMQKQRVKETIWGDIYEALTKKAKAAGYYMVWNTSAIDSGGGLIVPYSNDQNDVTREVLNQLNLRAPAEFLKPADANPKP